MEATIVEDPIRRQRYRFSRTGDVLHAEVWADPGGDVPEHSHPSLEERFEVIDGEVTFRVDGRKQHAGPGDRLVAAAGVRHAFENTGPGVAHLRVEVEPASRLQEFLEEAAALARAGKYTRRGIPKGFRAALEAADFADRFRDVTVLRFPPPAFQRTFLFPLARFERRRRGKAGIRTPDS
jgi:mannose-6-phosphate isomerase-like protein (cupin superfamily)